ncbi:MAG TPA: GDP-mannose dehydrogenase, partial [Caldithrix sp.]|nr:GDP-mannose dehydrogenase [Caldithrix sp.]
HKPIAAAEVLLLGASYREDVGDTRYSGSEIAARKLSEMGAEVRVHDPYVDHWWELENQDNYPGHGHGKKQFFRNQEKLSEIRVQKDIYEALKGADAVIFAVRHEPYLKLEPEEVVKAIGKPAAIVDAFAILDDEKIRKYLELGCEVKAMGRGHISWIKEQIAKA